ncbi:VOC family protein [Labedaea rhizosphaerae]|uniref:Glyoxalase-like domain-containing protein n=1 Tax=Labedaea rhizosphaerae TaxID=598644 RepID=A0A4R6S0A2_LABRH|nr:VOC family protein [Labedaea rhizosphaerae]TDP92006.1 hypothetical protein EV186_108219 [Labedaea rhizosphaerae]
MAIKVQVTFDAHDAEALASFWQLALDYAEQQPPPGFATWQDFAAKIGMPEEKWHAFGAAIDPSGAGPRLFFQQVPEGKVAKNRVHLDLNVSGGPNSGEEGWKRVLAHSEKLVAAGASVQYESNEPNGRCLVMKDPEGNEFCIQ